MSEAATTAFVTARSSAVSARLAAGLSASGYETALLTDSMLDSITTKPQIRISFQSAAAVASGFATAIGQFGPPSLIVHDAASGLPMNACALTEISFSQWQQLTHATVKAALYCLQAAFGIFAPRGGGTVVMVGPAMSLVGAAGLVGLTTALEAQRSLLKSAARQWGQKGIRLHWVAMADAHYTDLPLATLPQVPELGPPPTALGRTPNIETDVARLLSFLAGAGGSALTGSTFNVDGGNWMVP